MTHTAQNGVLERMLRFMVDKRASDLYLSANSPPMIRISGLVVPITSQPLEIQEPLELLKGLVPAERLQELLSTSELNTVLSLENLGRFRISAFFQRGTVAIVIRYVPFDIPALQDSHLPLVLRQLVMEKRGLVLMVGASGAGKSTTLASMLDYRNATTSGHMLTFENPIEFVFRHKKSVINQREIGIDTQSLELALKNAMRQAPDVIFISEIRDRETMSAALSYAQSGHLCLATLHANNSHHALNRILGFYPAQAREAVQRDLSLALKAMLSQRLIRTNDGERVPACEVMVNTTRIAELIHAGNFAEIPAAMEQSLSAGSQSFEQDIARLISEGTVQVSEGLSHADSPTNLMWRMQNGTDAHSLLVSPPVGSFGTTADPITLTMNP
ncbi:MAG: PilT/PilU family type 4a pilus ATPase [Rhodoferax sp.]|nr:PilT/PilU family type 4a pilus ATPase [Rhodoferax sp.]